jgi:DNA repair protein RadC
LLEIRDRIYITSSGESTAIRRHGHLDGKNRIIAMDIVSIGSLNQSIVHPREVFKTALLSSAAAIIMVHQHPTGDPSPSSEDIAITRRLKEAGEIIGVKVLDHIIVGDGEY